MTDGLTPKPPGPVRGRLFEKGRSGNPAGRRIGCRNKTTIAAAALLAGESEALTRKAVELALVGDPCRGGDDRSAGRRPCPGDRDRRLRAAFAARRGRPLPLPWCHSRHIRCRPGHHYNP